MYICVKNNNKHNTTCYIYCSPRYSGISAVAGEGCRFNHGLVFKCRGHVFSAASKINRRIKAIPPPQQQPILPSYTCHKWHILGGGAKSVVSFIYARLEGRRRGYVSSKTQTTSLLAAFFFFFLKTLNTSLNTTIVYLSKLLATTTRIPTVFGIELLVFCGFSCSYTRGWIITHVNKFKT